MKVSGQVAKGKVTTPMNVTPSKAFEPLDKVAAHAIEPAVGGHAQPETTDTELGRIVRIEIGLIADSPYQNPYRRYDSESLDLLGGAMEEGGQGEPVQVRRKGSGYELLAGHRRVRAARIKGWTHIEALVFDLDDQAALQKVMGHNEGREDDPDFALAAMYRFALDSNLGNQKKIAKLFSTSPTHVSRCLAMLELPQPIVDMLKKKPDLFGVSAATVINELLKAHPSEEALIVKAVARLQTGAPASSIKSWFEQMFKQRSKKSPSTDNRPKVIADPNGRHLFSAKREGRVITVRISATDVDPELTMQKVMDSLKAYSTEDLLQK